MLCAFYVAQAALRRPNRQQTSVVPPEVGCLPPCFPQTIPYPQVDASKLIVGLIDQSSASPKIISRTPVTEPCVKLTARVSLPPLWLAA